MRMNKIYKVEECFYYPTIQKPIAKYFKSLEGVVDYLKSLNISIAHNPEKNLWFYKEDNDYLWEDMFNRIFIASSLREYIVNEYRIEDIS